MNEVPPVRFDVAAEPRHARLVRTAMGALAALESFSLDRTDDVRLLADEVFNAMIGAGAARVAFDAAAIDGTVRFVIRAAVTDGGAPKLAFDTVRRVAHVVAPGFALTVADGHAVFSATIHADPA